MHKTTLETSDFYTIQCSVVQLYPAYQKLSYLLNWRHYSHVSASQGQADELHPQCYGDAASQPSSSAGVRLY